MKNKSEEIMTQNQELIQTHGGALIFDDLNSEKIKGNPVAVCVASLVNAMKADFGHKFQSQFGNDEAVRQYKRRLYKKLENVCLSTVYDAYELFIDSYPRPEWPPTIPQLLGKVEDAEKAKSRVSKNIAEAQALSALPPPTIQCNPLEMLAAAKAKADTPENHADWMALKAALLQNHVAVLTLYGGNIRKPRHDKRSCAVTGCFATGSISASTRGDGNFYCAEHYFANAPG